MLNYYGSLASNALEATNIDLTGENKVRAEESKGGISYVEDEDSPYSRFLLTKVINFVNVLNDAENQSQVLRVRCIPHSRNDLFHIDIVKPQIVVLEC